jgi:DNA-binding response OmpR family regulator
MQKCVLIYDDDVEILILCKLILQKQNYKIETRSTCNNVIADINSLNPSVILMDLWIPTGGGEEAIRQIRENLSSKDIPILLFSANDDIENISKSSAANGFVSKPFDIHTFKNEIDKWI